MGYGNFAVSEFAQTDDNRMPTVQRQLPFRRWLLSSTVFFLVISACLTRGELKSPATIPLVSMDAATVPLFNAWTIGWNANRATHGFIGYWKTPIFFPAEDSFAFSEPQPATLIVAPVCWITGSAVAAYKAWMFLSLALNGFFTALLLRRFDHSLFVQLAGGTAMTLLPIVHQKIDVLQLVPVWGILWFWSSLFQLDRTPGPRTSIETGVAFATCFALCVHHALFLSMVLPFSAVVFALRFSEHRFLTAVFGAIAIAATLVVPIVAPIHFAANAHEFSRKESTVKKQSAKLEQYLATPPNSLIHFDRFEISSNRKFNVGWFRIMLAGLGIFIGLIFKKRGQWICFLAITTATAMTFSLGPNLELFGWIPWLWLAEHLPGVGQVRNVFRFAWLVQMGIVLLACEGLAGILAFCQERVTTRFRKAAVAIFVVLPGAIFATEIWPETPQRGEVPDVARHEGWTKFIRENRTANRPIVCLPLASGNSVGDFEMTTKWMLLGLEHEAPMLNGYSGFFPKPYFELRDFVNAEFPSESVLEKFIEHNIEFVVVDRSYWTSEELLTAAPGKLTAIYEDQNADIVVYKFAAP
jgi:hypothetical protein